MSRNALNLMSVYIRMILKWWRLLRVMIQTLTLKRSTYETEKFQVPKINKKSPPAVVPVSIECTLEFVPNNENIRQSKKYIIIDRIHRKYEKKNLKFKPS